MKENPNARLMRRYSLSYATPKGPRVRLFNLSESAVREIQTVQKTLGSSDFRIEEQERNYSQQEIDLIRRGEGDAR